MPLQRRIDRAFYRLAKCIVTLMLLACGFSVSADNVLRIANFGAPLSLDPHSLDTPWEARIACDLFLGLTTEAADATIVPGAAQKWIISEDGQTYTFTLRDHKWSDGTPVTAVDFVSGFRRLLDPSTASPHANRLYNIVNARAYHQGELDDPDALGVRAVGDRIVEITLNQPTTLFLEQLAHHSAYPIPSHIFEQNPDTWRAEEALVGNGAFEIKQWEPEKLVKLSKNPHFYDRESIDIDTVIYYSNTDYAAMKKRFVRGDIDITRDFPPSDFTWLKTNNAAELRVNPMLGVYYFAVNTRHLPLSDQGVRQALSMAIDRETITDKLLRSGEVPAYNLVPPGVNNYPEPSLADWQALPYSERLQRAASIMEQAGYSTDTPLKLILLYNKVENDMHGRVGLSVAAMWRQIHVDAELVHRDTQEHYKLLQRGRFQIARAGWIAQYNDAETFLSLLESTATPYNYGNFVNTAFDNAMYTASLNTDVAARGKLLAKAERIIMDEQAVIPIFYYVSRNLVSVKVKGWVDNTKDIHHTRYLRRDDSD